MAYLQLALGLLLLVGGGEALVRGAVAVARRLRLSSLLIGLTLASFGTSAPELVVCLDAALRGATDLAIGNVVGSNLANALLILPVAALIHPVAARRRELRRDGGSMLAATLLLVALLLWGGVAAWHGVLLLALLVASVVLVYRSDVPTAADEAGDDGGAPPSRPVVAAALVLAGLAGLAFGADLFVDGAVTIAHTFEVSETVIGLTLVAVGTSLPELFTTGIAALRGQSDIALGNVLGSNLFNVLGILGATALVAPLPVPADITGFDVAALLASAVLLVVFAATGARLNRIEAGLLLAGYLAYVGLKTGLFAI